MSFAIRRPSVGWEPVPLTADGTLAVWGWFKPQAVNSVALQIPVEAWQAAGGSLPITVRLMACATGIGLLQGWTLLGQFYPLNEQTAPLLDVPLLPPPAGVDPAIILWSGDVGTMPMLPPMLDSSGFS